jgi:hypothetical protein
VLTPYATERVVVDGLTGVRRTDNLLANRAAGFSAVPEGYRWHHVEDGRTMELVPKDLHEAVRHTGSAAGLPNLLDPVAPGGAFTPWERRAAFAGAGAGGIVGGPAAGAAGQP